MDTNYIIYKIENNNKLYLFDFKEQTSYNEYYASFGLSKSKALLLNSMSAHSIIDRMSGKAKQFIMEKQPSEDNININNFTINESSLGSKELIDDCLKHTGTVL